MNGKTVFWLLLFTLLTPSFASAAPFWGSLVECGNDVQVVLAPDPRAPGCAAGTYVVVGDCEFCDIVDLAQNIINFLVTFTIVVATLMFVYAGILFLTAGANEGNISKAKGIFWTVLLGLVFVLAAWLIVDIVMKTLYSGQWGPWNAILCDNADQPEVCRSINQPGEGLPSTTGGPVVMSYCFSIDIPNPSGGGWSKQCCSADEAQCTAARAPEAAKISGAYPAATNVTPCRHTPAAIGCTGSLGPFDTGTTTPPPPPPPGGAYARENCAQYTDTAVRTKCDQEVLKAQQIIGAGYTINKGFCHPNTRYQDVPGGCTDVGGLTGGVINTLITMMDFCSQDISRSCRGMVVTGGSEFGHAGGMSPPTCTGGHCAGVKVDFGFSDITNSWYNSDAFEDGRCSDGRAGRINADTNTCWVRESDHYDVLF